MKIALYSKTFSEKLSSFLPELINILNKNNCEISFNDFLYELTDKNSTLPSNYKIFDDRKTIEGVDVLLSIGGDGTLLDTISIIGDSGIPVLGINLGRLGFISSIPVDQTEKAIINLINKKYRINKRILIKADTNKSTIDGGTNHALNEIAIQKKDSSSMITIHTYVNNQFLNSYWADGLIISTPTGSTAYSLSCGGPILTPDSQNFIITPIAPHNLAVRPIVLPDDNIIKMKISDGSAGFWISLDSRYYPGLPGDEITVRKADFTVNFIELQYDCFFTALRSKLLWGRDIRN
jgi:NAD+ kinase